MKDHLADPVLFCLTLPPQLVGQAAEVLEQAWLPGKTSVGALGVEDPYLELHSWGNSGSNFLAKRR